MNQSEAFLFLTSCEFFLVGGGRENTNKKTRTVHAFSIFNQKMKIRMNFFHIKRIKIEKVINKKHFLASNSKLTFCTLSSWLVQKYSPVRNFGPHQHKTTFSSIKDCILTKACLPLRTT